MASLCEALDKVMRNTTANTNGIHACGGGVSANKIQDLMRIADLAISEKDNAAFKATRYQPGKDLPKRLEELRAAQVRLHSLCMVTCSFQRCCIICSGSVKEKLGAAAKPNDVEAASWW